MDHFFVLYCCNLSSCLYLLLFVPSFSYYLFLFCLSLFPLVIVLK